VQVVNRASCIGIPLAKPRGESTSAVHADRAVPMGNKGCDVVALAVAECRLAGLIVHLTNNTSCAAPARVRVYDAAASIAASCEIRLRTHNEACTATAS